MEARIDHARSAQDHIDWAHEQQAAEGQFEFTVRDNALIAQAHATLALVEQQRIANLIAMFHAPDDAATMLVRAGVNFHTAASELVEMLGHS